MIKDITHKYLRKELVNFENLEEFDSLFIELKYSTLIAPTNSGGDFLKLEFGDVSLIPLFTDIHEYEKVYRLEGIQPVVHEFKFYLNLFYNNDASGFVINDASERFYITDVFLDIMEIKFSDYKTNPFSLEEIKNIKESLNNSNIKKFLSNHVFFDFISFIDQFLNVDLLAVVKYSPNLKGVISVGPLPFFTKKIGRDQFALIYTSEDEINLSSKEGYYSQLVNLALLMKYVLYCDLEGIVLNMNSDNIVISRDIIKLYLRDSNCTSMKDYSHYIFEIE